MMLLEINNLHLLLEIHTAEKVVKYSLKIFYGLQSNNMN